MSPWPILEWESRFLNCSHKSTHARYTAERLCKIVETRIAACCCTRAWGPVYARRMTLPPCNVGRALLHKNALTHEEEMMSWHSTVLGFSRPAGTALKRDVARPGRPSARGLSRCRRLNALNLVVNRGSCSQASLRRCRTEVVRCTARGASSLSQQLPNDEKESAFASDRSQS